MVKKATQKSKNKSISKKLTKLSKFVYKTIEPKQISKVWSEIATGATWSYEDLTEMPSGTTATNVGRIGNTVTLTSINLKMSFNKVSPFVTSRVLIIQFPCLDLDLSPATIMPHILQYSHVDVVAGININHVLLSGYKVASALKFNILVDDLVQSRSASNLYEDALQNPIYAGQQVIRKYILAKRVRQKSIQFLPGAGATAAYKNIIVMYTINNNILLDAPSINYDAYNRFNYRDA